MVTRSVAGVGMAFGAPAGLDEWHMLVPATSATLSVINIRRGTSTVLRPPI